MVLPSNRPLPSVPPPPVVVESRLPRVLAIVGGVLALALLWYGVNAALNPPPSPQDEMWAAALAKAQRAPAQPGPLKQTGVLRITADDAEAQVWLDDEWVGVTPLAVSDVRAGVHGIRVETSGGTVLDSVVYVRRDDTTRLHVAAPAPTVEPPRQRRTRRRSRSSNRSITDALESLAPAPVRAPVPLQPRAPAPSGGGER